MKKYTISEFTNYKKVGEKDTMDFLMELSEKQGFDKEKTKVVYEKLDGKEVYSIEVNQ